MRCPDCGKFVAYDTDADPDVGEAQVDGGVSVSVEIRRILPCAECGTELKAYDFTLEDLRITSNDTTLELEACAEDDEGEHNWEVEETNGSNTERLNDKDKNGKQIKHQRYMTQYYGVEVEVILKCSRCQCRGTATGADEATAGSFEEQT